MQNKMDEYYVQREEEYFKAEQLKADWEKIKKDEYDDQYMNEFNKYLTEYNEAKAELEKMANEYKVTIEYLLKHYKEYIKSYDIFLLWEKMDEAVEKMNDLNKNKGIPIQKKLKNIDDQIKVSKDKYDDYANKITDFEDQITTQLENITALEEEIDQKCPLQSVPKYFDNSRSGDRGGKKSEQDTSERWSQEIDSQSRGIDEIVIPEAFEFEFSEEFVIDENSGRNSERVTR